jgi:hypothetical protein
VQKVKIILILLLCFISACQESDRIRPGVWTINNPVIYRFDPQPIAGYSLYPSLTVGSNGVMFTIQISQINSEASPLLGKNIEAAIMTSSGALIQLDCHDERELTRIMGIPLAIWYFSPPEGHDSIARIRIKVRGQIVDLNFTDTEQITP